METSTRQYDWPRAGMAIIAHLIRGTIAYNKRHGLKPQSYRDFDGTSHTTVRNYSRCSIDNPQQKDLNAASLAVIAPHLYKFAGLNGNDVLFDPAQTYKDWKELAEDMENATIEIDDPDDCRVLPVPKNGLQLKLSKQTDQEAILAEMLDQITALRKEVESLKSWQTVAPAQPASVPSLTPMEEFLANWCQQASTEQLDALAITGHNWLSQREQILDAITREGMVDRARAEEILLGTKLKKAEELLLCYLFQTPVSGTPYSIGHWAKLSHPELAIAS